MKKKYQKYQMLLKNQINVQKILKKNLLFGIKEKSLEKKIIERLRNEYLDIVDIRVSFGENTSKTYLKATNNKLEDIDVVIIDITAKEYGKEYMATIARNFFVGDIEKKWPTILEEYTRLYYLEDKMILRPQKSCRNIRAC